MIRVGVLLVGLLASCAAGSSSGDTSSTPGEAGNAMPEGAIGFFSVSACPSGWEPYTAAAGRTLLPTIAEAPGGASVGEPLASGEDRMHTHGVAASFELSPISYAGVAGCCNTGVAEAGTATFTATSDAASTGLPYVQLLVCKKTAAPTAGAIPLPARMTSFFDTQTCPEGWIQASATQGRLVVGLPKDAPADVSFGADPLSSAAPSTHSHANEVSLPTMPHGIALASGCCGDGYAQTNLYSTQQDTDATDATPPYLELLHCEKL